MKRSKARAGAAWWVGLCSARGRHQVVTALVGIGLLLVGLGALPGHGVAAPAAQARSMPLLGCLSEGMPGPNPLNDVFWDGMRALGWREGETIAVETRYAAQSYERLHEAAERMADGAGDWAALALDLGYFDQAHFINDFRRVVGRSPAEYAAQAA